MARRKKQLPFGIVVLGVVLAGICVVQVSNALARDVIAIFTILLFVVAALILLNLVAPAMLRHIVVQRVDAITDEHMNALVRQRTMQIRSDPYGKPILDRWHSEVSYFITHHVRPAMTPNQQVSLDKERATILRHISQRVALAAENRPKLVTVPAEMTGAEFETFCAERLRASGWEVWLTPPSGDQGVDVIAEKNAVRVVLQCKLYSNPVGNKAVQEIAAGRIHQQAHHGAVVTNGTYTTSAKQLAATNGIRLLHHTDLSQLEQLLDMTTSQ